MRKFEGLKIVRGLVFALGVAGAACSQGVAEGDRVEDMATTSQAALIPIAQEDMMTCVLCYGEEGGGQGGSGNMSPGMEIFMGAMLEWGYTSPGLTPIIARSPADKTPCPPNTDCVTVTDKPRPTLDEDRRWVTIVASETRRVSVLLPEGRPAPARIGPAKKASCHSDAPSSGGQCIDWHRLCMNAINSKEAWDMFLKILWDEGEKVLWGIMKAGLFANKDGRENLCNAMFAD